MKFPEHCGIIVAALLGALHGSGPDAACQERGMQDFGYIKESDGWLTSENASGLLSLPVRSTSFVETSFRKDNGGFVNYSGSDDSFDFGLQTESYCRLDRRVALYGNISYDFFQGKNMTGSVFADPYYNPTEIVESDPEMKGKKQKETYHLEGGFGAALTSRLDIGGKISYTSLNYAKMKDLRHVNSLMDMTVTAGLRYRIGTKVFLGLDYLYRRSVEAVRFQQSGEGGRNYYSLVSFGAFYGMEEVFNGESGYTSSNSQPMFNRFHGGALQVDFPLSRRVDWFHEVGFRDRAGYYGEKSSKTITFTEHQGQEYAYRTGIYVRKSGEMHKIGLEARYEVLTNSENVYKMSSGSSDGNSTVQYFGSNEVLSRDMLHAELAYSGFLGLKDFMPAWTVNAVAGYSSMSRFVSIYPFYRNNSAHLVLCSIRGGRNFMVKKSMYSVELEGGYGTGWGIMADDGTYTAVSDSQEEPDGNTVFLEREFEYLTAGRLMAGAGFRYSRLFGKGIRGYAGLKAGYVYGHKTRYIGNTAFTGTVTVGCSF